MTTAGIAAIVVFLVGVITGAALKGSGSSPTAATTSPTATATVSATPTATVLFTPPGTTATPSTATTPTPSHPTPTPAQGSAALVFNTTYSFTNCTTVTSAPYSCQTVELAEFSETNAPTNASYTAAVSFRAGVTMPTGSAGTTDQPEVVSLSGGSYSHGVTIGELEFPGEGAFQYTVKVTDTTNGDSASWVSSLQVGS